MSTTEVETMPEPVATETQAPNAPAAFERDRERRRPSLRNRTIYERRVLGGETLVALAKEYNVTHQCISQIATRVEGWIASHPEDHLANRLRLRCRLRYEALYESAVTGFADSRKQEVTVKQRKTSRARKADEGEEGAKPDVVTTVEERITRQRHGDPRLLATAMKAVEKLERFAKSIADGERASPEKSGVRQEAGVGIQGSGIREEAGVEIQGSGVTEESCRQPETASLATHHTPLATPSSLPTADCPLPTAPATPSSLPTACCPLPTAPATPSSLPTADCPLPTAPTTPPVPRAKPNRVLIIAHYKQVERMWSVARERLPGFKITTESEASSAKEWLDQHIDETALVWIDSDLGPVRHETGGTIRPGTGREVAERLAEARPFFPVLVNEGDDDSRPLCSLLEAAGCSVEEVFHHGGDWLRDNWAPALRGALGLPEEDDDFDFDEDDEDDFE
jgi:hypothetical protein